MEAIVLDCQNWTCEKTYMKYIIFPIILENIEFFFCICDNNGILLCDF